MGIAFVTAPIMSMSFGLTRHIARSLYDGKELQLRVPYYGSMGLAVSAVCMHRAIVLRWEPAALLVFRLGFVIPPGLTCWHRQYLVTATRWNLGVPPLVLVERSHSPANDLANERCAAW